MEPTPAPGSAARHDVGEKSLPVDPGVPPRDRVLTAQAARGGGRRRARPRLLWRRIFRSLARRRDVLVVVALGGGVGSLARWGLNQVLSSPEGSFPWSTFAENVSGSFLLGALMVLAADVWSPSRYVRPFFAVGVLGGYTTFSTYVLDTRALLIVGQARLAAAYLLGSLAAGLAAVWLGVATTRGLGAVARIWRRARREPGTPDGERSRRDPAASIADGDGGAVDGPATEAPRRMR